MPNGRKYDPYNFNGVRTIGTERAGHVEVAVRIEQVGIKIPSAAGRSARTIGSTRNLLRVGRNTTGTAGKISSEFWIPA